MALSDNVLGALRTVFGRERDERLAAQSPSADIRQASPSSYSSIDGGEYGGLLSVSQGLTARYADYECLTGDTLVQTLEGPRKLVDLAKACEDDPNYQFPVFTWDHSKRRVTVGMACAARFVKVAKVYEVELDDGQKIRATDNHQWMLRDGSYAETKTLSPQTSLMPLYLSNDTNGYLQYKENEEWHRGALTRKDSQRTRPVYRMVAEWKLGHRIKPRTWVKLKCPRSIAPPDKIEIQQDKQPTRKKSWQPWVRTILNAKSFIEENKALTRKPAKKNHKVVSVTELGEEPVFCLEVPGTKNFAIGDETGGVFTHNSMDDYPDINCFAEGSMVTIVSESMLRSIPIEKLAYEGVGFQVPGYDRKKGFFKTTEATDPRLTGRDAEIIAIPLSNGRTLRVTPDHKVLVPSREILEATGGADEIVGKPTAKYVDAKTLKAGDLIVAMPTGFAVGSTVSFLTRAATHVRVLSDPTSAGKAKVFDITTVTHNLVVEGVVCHNSSNHYFASDSTQPDPTTGRIIWVQSKDDAIKGAADTLIKRRLRLDDEMFSMAYTLVKYGNDFEEVLCTKNGVVGLNYLPPATMRRVEHDDTTLIGYLQDLTGGFGEDMASLRKKIATPGQLNDNVALFEDWQVVHTRLRSRHRRSPYGYGTADGARWIWKRLIMLEDAMLIYKLTRAPARFAFYIDVTDIPANRVESFLQRAKRDLKKKKFVDPNSGRLNMRYNPLAQDEDFFLPVRDGKELARVDILSGPDYQAIEDVNYFQRKLHGVLKTPRSWLGQEDATPSRGILSNEDARAARVTLGIQTSMRAGIEKIVRIDMAARGVTDPWKPEFDVMMTLPSGIWTLAHMEIQNALADYASRIEPWVSRDYIRREILKLTDKDIGLIDKQKKREMEIEMQAQGGGGGFGETIEALGRPLTEEETRTSGISKRDIVKMNDSMKRMEDRLDRKSRERDDHLMEKLDQSIHQDRALAARHDERLTFFSQLQKAVPTNGAAPPTARRRTPLIKG